MVSVCLDPQPGSGVGIHLCPLKIPFLMSSKRQSAAARDKGRQTEKREEASFSTEFPKTVKDFEMRCRFSSGSESSVGHLPLPKAPQGPWFAGLFIQPFFFCSSYPP